MGNQVFAVDFLSGMKSSKKYESKV